MSGSKASNSKTLLIVAQEVPMILRTNCLAIAKVIIRLQIYTHIHTHSNRLLNTFYIFLQIHFLRGILHRPHDDILKKLRELPLPT